MAVEKTPLAVAPDPQAREGVPVAVPDGAGPDPLSVTQASCAAAGVAVNAVARAIADPATRYFLIVIFDNPFVRPNGLHSGRVIQSFGP